MGGSLALATLLVAVVLTACVYDVKVKTTAEAQLINCCGP